MSLSSSVLSTLSTTRAGVRGTLTSRAGLVQITAAAVLWGTTGVAVQLVRQRTDLGAVSIGFYRLAVAATVLLVLSAPRLRLLVRALRGAPVAMVLTGLGLAAYQVLYFLAVVLAGVGVATMVSLGVAPIAIAGWEAARRRRAPGRSTVVTTAAGVTGLVLITVATAEPTAAATQPRLGLLAAFGSGLGYAASTVLSRHSTRHVPPMTLTTLSTCIGAVALAPLAAGQGVTFTPGVATVGLLAYLGVVATALAYALFYAGLRTTDGSAAAVLTLLEPLTAALLAGAVLAEPLPALAVLGGLLLLGAVVGLYRRPPDRSARTGGLGAPAAAPAVGPGPAQGATRDTG